MFAMNCLFKEDGLEGQIGKLQSQVTDCESMCLYCATKLDVHIGKSLYEVGHYMPS